MFGRVTVERTRRKLVKEAEERIQRYTVLALESQALAERSALNARQYKELADLNSRLLTTLNQGATKP
jgi:hypothetical protein